MQCMQLCNGLVRRDADGYWSLTDFLAIMTQKRRKKIKLRHRPMAMGPRGWGVLVTTKELQDVLALLKEVDKSTRVMVNDTLARILAGEDGFIEHVTEDAILYYHRNWKRGKPQTLHNTIILFGII